MNNVLELFASRASDALKEKGRCSMRVRARSVLYMFRREIIINN